jgi:hypothetical protein
MPLIASGAYPGKARTAEARTARQRTTNRIEMSEVERTMQTIARVKAKHAAAGDPESRRYYELCLIGWRAWLAKLERDVLIRRT